MKNHASKIIFILGPTAVGKTAVSIELAEKLNAEIISCDAMQVYQDVFIATNKPSDEEMQKIPHHLIDCIPLSQSFDVARFLKIAQPLIDELINKQKNIIVAGGTGMYAKALLDGIFESVPIPDDIRDQLEREKKENGLEVLYRELMSVDPLSASRIHQHDERRILRALEVYRAVGVPISDLQKNVSGIWGKYPVVIFGLEMDRARLYDRINCRVEEMFEAGLIDEIKKIKGAVVSRTAAAIIGLKEVSCYLDGQCTLEAAKEEMKKNTRRLAKRQLTWFRADSRIRWISIDKIDTEQIINRMIREVNGAE